MGKKGRPFLHFPEHRSIRKRLNLQGELLLALMPTIAVMGALFLVKDLSKQILLFSSLAASAFLIYLDPRHTVNRVRTLVIAQLGGAGVGWIAFRLLGHGILTGGVAMAGTILLMVLLNATHPPALSTCLIFAFRVGKESDLILFGLSVLVLVMMIVLEISALWILDRFEDNWET
jgi:CBS-domain-containing membrane protein